MHSILLLVPFLVVRFLLLSALDKKAVQRAAHFVPMQGREKTAYYIYQISNIVLFIYLFFLTVKLDFSWQFYVGTVLYLTGLCLCAASMVNFSSPDDTGLNINGIYRFSRNPMYVAYFVCFTGMACLTRSWILLGLTLVFQISGHWIILSEERWCAEKFGDAYEQYRRRVRRYI